MTKRLFSIFSISMALACGGQTAPAGTDGGADSGEDAGPTSQCHGYCPQPNGSTCASDCDCFDKCVSGKDTPPQCGAPIVPSISCGDDAAACPSGQTCGSFGYCTGGACTISNECPSKQQCTGGKCTEFGCI